MASKRGNGRQAVRNGNGAPGWILFGSGVVIGAFALSSPATHRQFADPGL